MKFFSCTILSLLIGLFTPLYADVFSVEHDTCKPSFSDIYDFNVGDVFQYRTVSTRSAGGINPTVEIITQYTILDKNIDSNIVSYYINGWEESNLYQNNLTDENAKIDTSKNTKFIDKHLVFIDSTTNYLNSCPKDIVRLPNDLFNSMVLEDIYSKVQTSFSDSILYKSIGGQANVLAYNNYDSLVQMSNLFFKAIYRQGLGLINQEFIFPEIKETIELEAYVKGQDTVGVLRSGEYPEYSVTSIEEGLQKESILVYPNPTDGTINIKNTEQKIIYAEIFNINGQKVFEEITPSPYKQIDIRFLNSGIYFIQLLLENGKIRSDKLIVK